MSGRVETDPIGAIRHELVAAAERRIASRRRRRRALVAATAVVVALGATSGALALTNTATGIPAIDRVLDLASRPGAYAPGKTPPGAPAAPDPNHRPVPGTLGGQVELALPTGDGVAVGYMNRDGMVCTALGDVDPPPAGEPSFAGITCVSGRGLARELEDSPARLVGGGGGDRTTATMKGFTRGDVESLTVSGARGDVEAVLSPVWTPRGWDGPPLRFFIALVDARDVRPGGSFPTLRARLADGRVEAWP